MNQRNKMNRFFQEVLKLVIISIPVADNEELLYTARKILNTKSKFYVDSPYPSSFSSDFIETKVLDFSFLFSLSKEPNSASILL